MSEHPTNPGADSRSATDAAAGAAGGEPLPSSYHRLMEELREAEIMSSAVGILSWDQETMLPPRGAPLRAEQIALLSTLTHQRQTSPRVGELIAECEQNAAIRSDARAAANLAGVRREFDRAVQLPTELVREMAHTSALAQHAWRDAREQSDFGHFAPWLEKIVGLNRAKAQCFDVSTPDEAYDALMEDFEPGARSQELEQVFATLREQLAPLIRGIGESPRRPDDRLHRVRVPIPQQVRFGTRVAEQIGFAFDAGRLDTSTHPFCQGIGPGDTRLTTRYREDGFPDALSSTLHETGHGLYEQGLPKEDFFGQPLGSPASLGIHESQSRLWENLVGRSRAFWEWALPEANRLFPGVLDGIDVEEAYCAMNLVEPGLIRVDSDEATYNLHIMLRFDLERAMLSDDLRVPDLPDAWNERVREDLGVRVPDDRQGCLQDIHWSMGALGYFPTYTLGNLYAAQFWEAAQRDIPDLDKQHRRGEFRPLLEWLRSNIHRHGRRYTAGELCERVTGAPLSPGPLVRNLEQKLRPVYGL